MSTFIEGSPIHPESSSNQRHSSELEHLVTSYHHIADLLNGALMYNTDNVDPLIDLISVENQQRIQRDLADSKGSIMLITSDYKKPSPEVERILRRISDEHTQKLREKINNTGIQFLYTEELFTLTDIDKLASTQLVATLGYLVGLSKETLKRSQQQNQAVGVSYTYLCDELIDDQTPEYKVFPIHWHTLNSRKQVVKTLSKMLNVVEELFGNRDANSTVRDRIAALQFFTAGHLIHQKAFLQ